MLWRRARWAVGFSRLILVLSLPPNPLLLSLTRGWRFLTAEPPLNVPTYPPFRSYGTFLKSFRWLLAKLEGDPKCPQASLHTVTRHHVARSTTKTSLSRHWSFIANTTFKVKFETNNFLYEITISSLSPETDTVAISHSCCRDLRAVCNIRPTSPTRKYYDK